MDQKSYIYIYSFVILNLVSNYTFFLVAQSYYFILLFFLVIFNVTNSFVILEWKYTLMDMIMLYAIIYLWTYCHPTWTHYTDSEPTRLCSFSLMLHT